MGLLLIFLHLWHLIKCIRSARPFFETFLHIGHFCGCEEAPWALLLCSWRLCFCENVMPHILHGKRIPSWRFLWSLRCRFRAYRVLSDAPQILHVIQRPSCWSMLCTMMWYCKLLRVLRDAPHTVHGKRRPSWRFMWSLMCFSMLGRFLRDAPHKSHVKRDESSTNQTKIRIHGIICYYNTACGNETIQ